MTDSESEITEPKRTLLIVEDDERFARTLADEFRDRGYEVEFLDTLQAVRDIPVLDHRYAIVDLRIRQDSGLDVITAIKERSPETSIVVLTGYGSIATAVRATKLGATGYLGLVRPAQAPRFRVVPGARVFVRQPVRDPLKVEMSYTVGSEIIVHPVTFEESNLVTHELKFGAHIEATARLGFTASYSLLAWTDTPVFHALGVEVRTLW